MKPYFQDDVVTIYHGDCREILPTLDAVDLVLTDPPYNLGKDYGNQTNDRLPEDVYWPWFNEVFGLIFSAMEDGYIYVPHSDRGVYKAMPALEQIGFKYVQTLIWWGRNGYSMQLHRKTWSFRHEPILFMAKGDPGTLETGEPGMWYTSVIEVPRPQSNFKEGRCHPTQKPVLLYKTLAQRTPGTVILDPFMGSGTTLRAAKDLGRKAIGIEIEERYCEIAAKRMAQGALQL